MKKARKVPAAFASEAEERAYWKREGSTANLDWRRAEKLGEGGRAPPPLVVR